MRIDRHDELPPTLMARPWSSSAPAAMPNRLVAVAKDSRWRTTWLVAVAEGRPLGILTVHEPRTARVGHAAYDLSTLPEALGSAPPQDPRSWTFVGGCSDFVAGAAVVADLGEADRASIRKRLVAHAFSEAETKGAYPVALHVREKEAPIFAEALGDRACVRPLNETATLSVGPDSETHMAALSRNQRARCRRDTRKFAESGYSASCVPASCVVEEAAPLVVALKAKYGATDHPRLASYRIAEWIDHCGPEHTFASVVRGHDGELLVASFLAVQGEVLEGFELGIIDDFPDREHAYLQATIHSAVELAHSQGCRILDLGLDASDVKQRRGAVVSHTWAISLTTD